MYHGAAGDNAPVAQTATFDRPRPEWHNQEATPVQTPCDATYSMLPDQQWKTIGVISNTDCVAQSGGRRPTPRRSTSTDLLYAIDNTVRGRTAKTRMQQQRTRVRVANATHKWAISRKYFERNPSDGMTNRTAVGTCVAPAENTYQAAQPTAGHLSTVGANTPRTTDLTPPSGFPRKLNHIFPPEGRHVVSDCHSRPTHNCDSGSGRYRIPDRHRQCHRRRPYRFDCGRGRGRGVDYSRGPIRHTRPGVSGARHSPLGAPPTVCADARVCRDVVCRC